MKKLGKLKLNQINKSELEQKQMSLLKGGGYTCNCACTCHPNCACSGGEMDNRISSFTGWGQVVSDNLLDTNHSANFELLGGK